MSVQNDRCPLFLQALQMAAGMLNAQKNLSNDSTGTHPNPLFCFLATFMISFSSAPIKIYNHVIYDLTSLLLFFLCLYTDGTRYELHVAQGHVLLIHHRLPKSWLRACHT